MDATEWDARYAGSELVWGAEPNRFVAAELADRAPGRALDVACGEGRNAIWLATRGWIATGVDFSSTAVDRARRLAAEAGVGDRTAFVVGDVLTDGAPADVFDAVIVAYLHLPADPRRRALGIAAGRLAPGGVLVVVGHDTSNLTEGVGGPQDASVLFTPEEVVEDVKAALGESWVVDKAERVLRPVGDQTAVDALVVGHRA